MRSEDVSVSPASSAPKHLLQHLCWATPNLNSALRTDIDLLCSLIGPLVGVSGNAPPSRTKPLARKRPGLIPILDEKGSIADRKAKGNANGTYWDSIISEMCQYQNQIQSGVTAMRQRGIPSEITELRVVDILVWMFRTKQRSACAWLENDFRVFVHTILR